MKHKLFVSIIFAALLSIATVQSTLAHSGRTDSSGGHNCSEKSIAKGLCTGYHSHNGGSTPATTPAPVVTTPDPTPITQPVAETKAPVPVKEEPKPEPVKTSSLVSKFYKERSISKDVTLADLILKELNGSSTKAVSKTVDPKKGSKASGGNSTQNSSLYKVAAVIDGDTIDVDINGKKERIRLIGMDTPETVDPRKPVQCFGKEASNKAKELLVGKKVKLESDAVSGDKDKYNRLLRYAILEDGTNFGKLMISEGYATEYTYQSQAYKYQKEFKDAQKKASEAGKGLWSTTTCAGDATKAAH